MTSDFARALFAPRTVALVGASGDAGKNTARPQRFLARHGFAGTVLPINPGRATILGARAYPSLAAAQAAAGPIDHVFVMAPGAAVEHAVDECGACGIPVVSIFSDGFAEVGAAGLARQDRLAAAARRGGVRLLGPNSMGVVDVPGRVTVTVNAVLEGDLPPAGGTSVISQSGTMLGTLMSRGAARGLGFAKLVAVGNEADIGVAELMELLVDDPDTRVIALFLETVRDAGALARAARRAHAAGKPVIAYKLGRSSLGEAMARSHTGALAGSDAAVDAFLRACGIVRVEMLETLIEIPPLLAGRAPPDLARRPRVAVVTTTGGGAASVVDRLGMLGLDAMTPSPALRATLEGHGVRVADSPIVDLTMAGSGARYAAVLDTLLGAADCDAVLAVVGSSAQFHPQVAVEPILRSQAAAKPLAAFLTPQADQSLRLLAARGIAAFRTPEACADALAAFFRWRAPRPEATGAPPAGARLPASARPDEADALALFASLGIPVIGGSIATAPDFAHDVPYPVVAKVRSADIAHKTEAGGVILGIADAAAFAAQVPAMLERVARRMPHAHVAGVLVQPMARGLAEAILGYRDDPMVGPVVMLGVGGTLAEIYRDSTLAPAPVAHDEALAMIEAVRGLAVIRGYRNLPRGDLDALARALVALSQLALLPGRPVAEAEINPLIVRTDGVVAVDGLLVLRPPPTGASA
ncbi:MAG: acetate--CoA ligase family protein [Burkholderiales bacterium]|nr:acetate--CoA ligase family protein [Burkholderiales bacterium]